MIFIKERLSEKVLEHIEQNKDTYVKISQQIYENPEKFAHEYFASQLLMEFLQQNDFTIQKGIEEYSTAFIARKRSQKSGQTVALFAEYNTLCQAGCIQENHMVAIISIAAAIALGEIIAETGGEVIVYGTPADINHPKQPLKDRLLTTELFQTVDVAVLPHTGEQTNVIIDSFHALSLDIDFIQPTGSTNNPLVGLVQLFHEIHQWEATLSDQTRIHGVILEGGQQPTSIPKKVKGSYVIQSNTVEQLQRAKDKIIECARIASSQNECQLLVSEHQNQMDSFVANDVLQAIFQAKVDELGRKIPEEGKKISQATDIGNVSQKVPTLYPSFHVKQGNKDHLNLLEGKDNEQEFIFAAQSIALTLLEILMNNQAHEKVTQTSLLIEN